jgi:hypothetical protein
MIKLRPNKLVIFIIFVLSSSFGCQSYRNVENLKPRSAVPKQEGMVATGEFNKIKKRDKIIVWAGERAYYIEYDYITDGQLKGKLWKDPVTGQKISPKNQYEMTIPLHEISELKVYRLNTWLNVSYLVATTGIFYLILINMNMGFALYD